MNRSSVLLRVLCVLCGVPFLSSCGGGNSNAIVIYSPHGHLLEDDIKQRFEAAHPGYSVQFLDMSGGLILERVSGEKERPGADAWWGGSPGDFRRAEAQGLLEAYALEWTKDLPADAKSQTGGWIATFRTPEVVMYNARKVSAAEAPKNWDELLDPKWKGRIIIRDVRQSATMKTIFGSLILREQERTGKLEAGFEFLRKLDANTGAYAANPQALYTLLESPDTPYAVTLWNLADALLLKGEGHPFEAAIPPQTPMPVEPIAIIKGAKNIAGAKLFHDFVNDPQQLIWMAQKWHRLPVRASLPAEQLPKWMKDLKSEPMKIDWERLDKNTEEWIARWDAEIKGKYRK